jgi:hypothetical protein
LFGILVAVLAAAIVFWLCSMFLPYVLAVVAAVLVLLAGIPTGGYGFGGRFSARRY